MSATRSVLVLMLCASASAPAGARQEQPLAATRLAAGAFHTCALSSGGRTLCWGDNRQGQSGGGSDDEVVSPRSIPGPRLVEITAGGRHTCGLDEKGHAWCWGDNTFGQLGNGARTRRDEPTGVKGDIRFVAITAGDSHTCALTPDGQAWCWGDQWDRAAGAFRAGASLTEPFPVKGDIDFEQVASGGHHTCGVTRERETWCWGNNTYGQSTPATGWGVIDYPEQVGGLPPARAVRAGASFSCVLALNGSVHCWGLLTHDSISIAAPQAIGGTFDQIVAGARHICGRTASAETYCWGDNSSHQIGAGPAGRIGSPAAVPSMRAFHSLSAGTDHTCGLDEQGLVYCWGDNTHGQLGQPGPASPTPRPVRVSGP